MRPKSLTNMGVFKPMLAMFMNYVHKCNIYFLYFSTFNLLFAFLFDFFINIPQIGMFCS